MNNDNQHHKNLTPSKVTSLGVFVLQLEKKMITSDEVILKTYTECKQRELNEKGEKTGKALGKHAINL